MKAVYILMKPASGLCNMRCKYCFYKDEMYKRKESSYGFMNEDTLEQVIAKGIAFAEEECSFSYQGGEPTLRGIEFFKKSIQLQEKYNHKRIKINNVLQTNGYLVDKEWCEFFAQNNFLIGLSIDGTRRTHDMNRINEKGEGTFFKCMKVVELLEKYKVEYNILTVVNRQTAPKVHRIYQEYQNRKFYYQQYIACLDPIYEVWGKEKYSLTPYQYGKFLVELFSMWSADLKKGKQPYIRMFENYISILIGEVPESCEQNGICGYQNVVEADGSVYPCDFYMLDEYRLGNLNQDTFEKINIKRAEIKFIQQSENHSKICEKCTYFALCRGGCRRYRILDKNKSGYINYYCQSYQMLFEKHYDVMQRIAREIIWQRDLSKTLKI